MATVEIDDGLYLTGEGLHEHLDKLRYDYGGNRRACVDALLGLTGSFDGDNRPSRAEEAPELRRDAMLR